MEPGLRTFFRPVALGRCILLNAHHEEIHFVLPARMPDSGWFVLVDTSCQTSEDANRFYSSGDSYPLQPRSLVLLVERAPDRIRADNRRRTPAP